MGEFSRQLVHLSGLVFIFLALFMDKMLVSAYFFMIALSLLIYSLVIRRQYKGIAKKMQRLEKSFRYLISNFERDRVKIPFIGAFWLYFSCGLVLLFFPLVIAIVSCSILAVADSVSTVVGTSFGNHKLVGSKSWEGSLSFFISAFVIAYMFTPLWVALAASLTATISELIPDLGFLRKLKEREILDDNFTVPVITGILLFLIL